MTATLSITARKANLPTERLFGGKRTEVRWLESVMRVLHAVYPVKTAANIAVRAGTTTRAAEYWIAGKRDMNADAFVALLSSDNGDKVLEAVMLSLPKRERPHWWTRHANTARMAQVERLQAQCDAEIRQLRLEIQ